MQEDVLKETTSETPKHSRRSFIQTGAALVGTAAGTIPLSQMASAQTPTASPDVPSGAIVSNVEGVPVAYTTYPDPFKSVEAGPEPGAQFVH